MYTLRNATESDLGTLVRHRRAMWVEITATEPKFADIGPTELHDADGRYHAWLLPKLRSREVIGCIAKTLEDGPVASGCLWYREEVPRPTRPQARMPYILSVFTEPGHRRHGLGRDVTAALIDTVAREGYRKVRLNASTLGEPLYRSMGFESSSERQLDLIGWRPPGSRLRPLGSHRSDPGVDPPAQEK
ncbi:MAG: GNAT family N-acetyltransferase [Thermoplasmata archaeon]|nr:GNAT family N-acetyltransferase [Thermoplasmata archaeon]